MNQASAKTINRTTEIENYILEGRVLDEHGNWIPIADKKASEDAFVAHLSAGQVLHEGRWVPIAEAKAARSTSGSCAAGAREEVAAAAIPFEKSPGAAGDSLKLTDKNGVPIDYAPETANILMDPRAEEETTSGLDSTRSGFSDRAEPFAPETKSFLIVPPTPLGNPFTADPVSDYAPETGLFILDGGDKAAQPAVNESPPPKKNSHEHSPEIETKAMPRLSSPPSTPLFEHGVAHHKGKLLIIGAVVVALIGMAAIAAFVMQVLR
jgi:hypothetical protein